jgi:hypothetical protein
MDYEYAFSNADAIVDSDSNEYSNKHTDSDSDLHANCYIHAGSGL